MRLEPWEIVPAILALRESVDVLAAENANLLEVLGQTREELGQTREELTDVKSALEALK